jgi:hypothetical protein
MLLFGTGHLKLLNWKNQNWRGRVRDAEFALMWCLESM